MALFPQTFIDEVRAAADIVAVVGDSVSLRKGLQAFLKTHPLVEKHYPAPDNQGGGGATIVELKD